MSAFLPALWLAGRAVRQVRSTDMPIETDEGRLRVFLAPAR
jgi:hypothetical protein